MESGNVPAPAESAEQKILDHFGYIVLGTMNGPLKVGDVRETWIGACSEDKLNSKVVVTGEATVHDWIEQLEFARLGIPHPWEVPANARFYKFIAE